MIEKITMNFSNVYAKRLLLVKYFCDLSRYARFHKLWRALGRKLKSTQWFLLTKFSQIPPDPQAKHSRHVIHAPCSFISTKVAIVPVQVWTWKFHTPHIFKRNWKNNSSVNKNSSSTILVPLNYCCISMRIASDGSLNFENNIQTNNWEKILFFLFQNCFSNFKTALLFKMSMSFKMKYWVTLCTGLIVATYSLVILSHNNKKAKQEHN